MGFCCIVREVDSSQTKSPGDIAGAFCMSDVHFFDLAREKGMLCFYNS